MTTTDMLNRINDALRSGDDDDLHTLADQIRGLLIDATEAACWLALIETAIETIGDKRY